MLSTSFDKTPSDIDILVRGFERRMAPHVPLDICRDVSVEATVALFLKLYQEAGPSVGCGLIDPACLLTLSGARGLTAWNGFWHAHQPEDVHTLTRLNWYLTSRGISLQPSFSEERYALQITNLAGVERVSRSFAGLGTLPYDADTGWEGFAVWDDRQGESIHEHYPAVTAHIYYGLLLGYPARAAIGYMCAGPDRNKLSVDVPVAYADFYECGRPEYDCLAVDRDDPTIEATARYWGELLTGIYEHSDMKRLDADPVFRSARARWRRLHLVAVGPDEAPLVSREAIRIGAAQGEKPA